VHAVGRETQMLSVVSSRLDELIEERALFVLGVPVARDESTHRALLFERDLHELAFFHKRVQAGVVRRSGSSSLSSNIHEEAGDACQREQYNTGQPHTDESTTRDQVSAAIPCCAAGLRPHCL
jgi:hypothetical protein